MTKDRNIQLRGNCQLCARLQAVVSGTGKIAKHGYTVDNGFFNGVCSGSRYAPMQESHAATDEAIRAILAEVEKAQELARALRDGKTHPESIKTNRPGAAPVAWSDATDYQRRDAVQAAIYRAESRARAGLRFADYLKATADERHGQPLVEVPIDAKPGIEVGSVVTCYGKRVTVEKIEFAVARGIGPGVNGKSIEHVFWTDAKGNTLRYPKRYARLAK